MFDVLIIGASVGGATLAHLLGRAGKKVALIDKATFPRRKACGEGITPRGVELLDRIGVLPSLLELPHHRFSGYRCWFKANHLSLSPLPTVSVGSLASLAIEREVLDNELLQQATSHPTVRVFLGEHVRSLELFSDHVTVPLSNESVAARFCVIADGGASVCSERVGFRARRIAPLRYGMSFIAEGEFQKPLSQVHLHRCDGYEVYFTQISPHRLNIAVLGDGEKIREWSHRTPELLRKAASTLTFSGEVLKQPLTIGPVNTAQRQGAQGRVLLVGDACEVFDPISGMGITHALTSASLAFECLLTVLSSDSERVLQEKTLLLPSQYSALREEEARLLRGTTYLVSSLLHSRHPEQALRLLSPALKTPLIRPVLNHVAKLAAKRAVSHLA